MRHVLIALIPAVLCALWFFGLPAMETLILSVAACMGAEWLINRYMLRRADSLADCSALLTGVLLALNLPASLPWWMTVAGAFAAIGIAKMCFGGLGRNIFNPALTGRVFLLISFPVAMTSWPLPDAGFGDADGATGATVLALTKLGELNPADIPYTDMLWGNMGGSMGEVGALSILLGFAYLLVMRVIKWHIPVAIVVGLTIIDLLAGYPVLPDILSGGLLFGAVFMATDYVTSPITRRGMLLYGILIGIIAASIRRWGAYPEGVSFAILLMNGCVPLIDRYIRPHRFSPHKKKLAA